MSILFIVCFVTGKKERKQNKQYKTPLLNVFLCIELSMLSIFIIIFKYTLIIYNILLYYFYINLKWNINWLNLNIILTYLTLNNISHYDFKISKLSIMVVMCIFMKTFL